MGQQEQCRCEIGKFHGNKGVILENGLLRVGVFPDKGADIFSVVYKPVDLELLARTHNFDETVRCTDFCNLKADSYDACYIGGWQSLIPAVGKRGDEMLGGGESATLPWQYTVVENTQKRVSVVFSTQLPKAGLIVEKQVSLEAGSSCLRVGEKVLNMKQDEIVFTWTQHPAFSERLLGEDTVFTIPECTVYDYVRKLETGDNTSSEHEYSPNRVVRQEEVLDLCRYGVYAGKENLFYTLKHLSEGKVTIKSPAGDITVTLRWDTDTYPHAWFWAENSARIRTVAFEPSTTYAPDFANSAERGLLITLKPQEEICTWLELECDMRSVPVSQMKQRSE